MTKELALFFRRRLNNQRVTIAPVMAVTCEQPHEFALALNDRAIAIVLAFMNPVRPAGTLVPRAAGFERNFRHAE